MKNIDIKINNNKDFTINSFERENHKAKIVIEGQEKEIDIYRLSEGYYSMLIGGRSINIELSPNKESNSFMVSCGKSFNQIDVIDAKTKYMMNRNKDKNAARENSIISPMPGKIVKILVEEGQKVAANETVIIVEAMKMQSEYKATNNSVVKEIKVNEGEIVKGNDLLIVFE